MPLKIRCKGCEKVLNLPDRVRGKAVKCPECQTVLRVPAGKSAAKQKRTPQPVPETGDDEEFLMSMDMRRAADTRVRVCVKCGAEVEEEEVVDCPECGHNVDTGIMSAAQRKRRSRRGPDPDEYWGVAWTGSLAFVRDNLGLVFRSSGFMVLFLTLALWVPFAILSTLVAFESVISPLVLWSMVTLKQVFIAGMTGWFWYASTQVIRHTMGSKRDKPMDHINFDFAQCIALGVKAVVWPLVLFSPLIILFVLVMIPVSISEGSVFAALATASIPMMIGYTVIYVGALLVLPLAMVHMTMPYTYKAWTPFHMGIALGKNILPALYNFVMVLAATLPFWLTVLIVQLAWEGGLTGFLIDIWTIVIDLSDALVEMVGMKVDKESKWMMFKEVPFMLPVIALCLTPFCIAVAFGAVFLMRGMGYVGLYFEKELDLVKEQEANAPCGFWPRYLAALVDGLVLAVGALLMWGVVWVLMYLAFMTGLTYLIELLKWVYIFGVGLLFPMFYFAKPQSSHGIQASIGKIALGLIVVTEDGKNMSFEAALGRFWVKLIVSEIPLGIGCMMAGFTEGKLALHDTIMKTSVVWKGDDERDSL